MGNLSGKLVCLFVLEIVLIESVRHEGASYQVCGVAVVDTASSSGTSFVHGSFFSAMCVGPPLTRHVITGPSWERSCELGKLDARARAKLRWVRQFGSESQLAAVRFAEEIA